VIYRVFTLNHYMYIRWITNNINQHIERPRKRMVGSIYLYWCRKIAIIT